ncbi:SAF domain-containing protein [Pseudonocardia kunmingensis]|uniref:SAF domain-containing protein n=1 Tax=Pseudonocardia kunmingensis TaxID=630975 RepID=UPI001478DC01|nr:SAF domain-containing protein [Pseudonocardia kunmingensis]
MVLAVVGALLGVYAYRGAVSREGVVAVARPLPFGAVIQLTDLREVQLPPDTGLATVAWRDVNSVIGSFTATDLHVGQTLTPESVTSQRSPAPGQAVVGLSVDAGQVPATPLAPRDDVLVIVGSGSPPRRASVVHAGEVDVSGRRSIDVLVPQADAEELALASMENRVAIVLVGRG